MDVKNPLEAPKEVIECSPEEIGDFSNYRGKSWADPQNCGKIPEIFWFQYGTRNFFPFEFFPCLFPKLGMFHTHHGTCHNCSCFGTRRVTISPLFPPIPMVKLVKKIFTLNHFSKWLAGVQDIEQMRIERLLPYLKGVSTRLLWTVVHKIPAFKSISLVAWLSRLKEGCPQTTKRWI